MALIALVNQQKYLVISSKIVVSKSTCKYVNTQYWYHDEFGDVLISGTLPRDHTMLVESKFMIYRPLCGLHAAHIHPRLGLKLSLVSKERFSHM